MADTSEGQGLQRLRPFVKLLRTANSWWSIRRSEAVYISVNVGNGMWLSTIAASLARLAGARLFLHHHSYAYVRERKRRMVVMTRTAGPNARHIVLSRSMASDLTRVMPEISQPLVIGNAGLIDQTILELPLKADGGNLVLGHLGSLTLEKGIGDVVDLAVALHQAGTPIRLIVGGPTLDERAGAHLERAAQELGELFQYRGPLIGQAKHEFFQEITHFVFPSRYVHEAVPLVLYEALAAGVVCVATCQGSIPEQLEASPSVLAGNADSFVKEALPLLAGASVSAKTSLECRQAYQLALQESERQLADLIDLIAGQ
ncbi:glycosyltransferase family 4 protein [Mycobacterium sp. RTGN5]|uniref:glycosyltransferase family 4 protein n=1 Tax=Mycobacterium sp. RTGN5 TaxID=3016522 RepID=UPI0029C612AC|nr:glycosyltransferase family 4 protein [Mycobacterium sp. RTGN5]